jgi:hypothetical protein
MTGLYYARLESKLGSSFAAHAPSYATLRAIGIALACWSVCGLLLFYRRRDPIIYKVILLSSVALAGLAYIGFIT